MDASKYRHPKRLATQLLRTYHPQRPIPEPHQGIHSEQPGAMGIRPGKPRYTAYACFEAATGAWVGTGACPRWHHDDDGDRRIDCIGEGPARGRRVHARHSWILRLRFAPRRMTLWRS